MTPGLEGWSRVWLLTVVLSGLAVLATPLVAVIQDRDDPSFEVASVQENASGRLGMTFRLLRGGRLRVQNHTLQWLVARAYERDIRQVVEGPDWIDRDRFDIEATFSDDLQGVESRVPAMLRNLLANRFQLRVRIEERESSYYALVLADPSGGLPDGIRRSTVDCDAYRDRLEREGPPTQVPTGPHCGLRFGLQSSGLLALGAGAVTMAEFADYLQPYVGRLTQDKTELVGVFDIDLTFRPDRSTFSFAERFGTSSTSPDGLPLFGALEQQLGLKLELQAGAVEMLIVEHAQRPSPN